MSSVCLILTTCIQKEKIMSVGFSKKKKTDKNQVYISMYMKSYGNFYILELEM